MTNYITVNGHTYWACPECGSITGCTFGHCLTRVLSQLSSITASTPPLLSQTAPEYVAEELRNYEDGDKA